MKKIKQMHLFRTCMIDFSSGFQYNKCGIDRKEGDSLRIAVLGAGAMGCLYGAMLSRAHDVTLVDRNADKAARISAQGLTLKEQDGTVWTARPRAALMGEMAEPAELVLVFVKAMATAQTLERCSAYIGENTLILTLQNGGGHEEVLSRFVPMEQVLLGTTQHNASVQPDGTIFHGGSGLTVIGSPMGASRAAERAAEAFRAAEIDTAYSDHIRAAIWEKLMTNVSLSVLTGLFQQPMGFATRSASCWQLCESLIREACEVARADGVNFDVNEKLEAVRAVSTNGPEGITSICKDLMQGRKTEVEFISGSVVRAARRLGVPAPRHEMMVLLIHAMEDRNEIH